jgi:hypothetical protein
MPVTPRLAAATARLPATKNRQAHICLIGLARELLPRLCHYREDQEKAAHPSQGGRTKKA